MTGLFNLGDHAGFIWGAYGAALLVLAGLVAWVRLDARAQKTMLQKLEAKGVQRRSKRTSSRK